MDRVLGMEDVELIGINNRNLGKASIAFMKNGLLYEISLLYKYMVVCYLASNLCVFSSFICFFLPNFHKVKV